MADFLIPLALLNESTKFLPVAGSGFRTHRRTECGAAAAVGAITTVSLPWTT